MELAWFYGCYKFSLNWNSSYEIFQWNENFQTDETTKKFDHDAFNENSD